MGTTFRRRSARVAVVIIAVFAYPLLAWRVGEFADGIAETGLLGLLAGLVVAAVFQTWRLGVVLRPDGVLVRNSWRDHFLPWAEIKGIDRELTGRIQRVSFLMGDGRVVPCDAMRGWASAEEPTATALVLAVTERLAAQETA